MEVDERRHGNIPLRRLEGVGGEDAGGGIVLIELMNRNIGISDNK